MKVNQTRNLLYDYARGALSDQERALVEKQLSNSEDLRKELKNVQLYYEMIESVEPVTVPDHFLDKVHSRIESQQKKALFSWLRLPPHVKLPMELAGILATVVLVVFIFIPELGRKNFNEYGHISSESGTPSIINKPIESERNDKNHTDESGLKTKLFYNENIPEKHSIESAKKPDIVPKEKVIKTKPALRSSPQEHPTAPLISKNEHENEVNARIVAAQPPVAEVSIPAASAPASPNIPEPEQQSLKLETIKEDVSTPALLSAAATPSAVSDTKMSSEMNNEFENGVNQAEPQKERQRIAKGEEEMRRDEIKRKIVNLESKRAKLRSPACKSSSREDAAYKDYSAKEDASDIYVDVEALMTKYGMKWTVKETLPGTKMYSARGTSKSVDLFIKKIKGKLNVNLIRTIPEDYTNAVDSVIVEFKEFKRISK